MRESLKPTSDVSSACPVREFKNWSQDKDANQQLKTKRDKTIEVDICYRQKSSNWLNFGNRYFFDKVFRNIESPFNDKSKSGGRNYETLLK